MMDFKVDQIFEGEYPAEAALWCNSHGDRYIDEIEAANGKRRFQIVAMPEPTEEEKAAAELEKAKAERSEAVGKITVEVDGMVFDGDEKAQSRMARAIQAAEITGAESTHWVLADNSVSTVKVAQIKQALAKAMTVMGELWTKPYSA